MSEIRRRDGDGEIRFDHVWKKFRRGESHDSLRDLLPALGRRLVGKAPPKQALRAGDFWALRDVTFRVGPGEALGIIGANGAGKSTVLKTLTQILRPTVGTCHVKGRAGALIEIAAGFHPDLTGRENVFLQGAIMGMRRAEIARKFDEIVEFSEITDFIDTPVKRYSSGMNARLGFSIAAHLDPDALIIDEVLSVGDMRFQQKAFDRIRDMARANIPVVVVSHQLDRIASLCTSALMLEAGTVVHAGSPAETIAIYLKRSMTSSDAETHETSVVVRSMNAVGPAVTASGQTAMFQIQGTCANLDSQKWEFVGIRVRSVETGAILFHTALDHLGATLPALGEFALDVELQMNLPPGTYTVESFVRDKTWEWWLGDRGAITYIQVTDETAFWGPVQMNARVAAVTAAAAPVAARVSKQSVPA